MLFRSNEKRIVLLAPIVKGRKGHYRELFEQVRKQGFTKVRVDGEIKDLVGKMQVDRYKIHDIELVIDRLEIKKKEAARLQQSIQLALKTGKGTLMVMEYNEKSSSKIKPRFFSRLLMCPTTGISYDEPAPNLFSFNSPYGACPNCNGLGTISEIDINKIVPDKSLSLKEGALAPVGSFRENWIFAQLSALGKHFGFTLNTPFNELEEAAVQAILFGSEELLKVKTKEYPAGYSSSFEGVASFIARQAEEDPSPGIQRWVQGFTNKIPCPTCNGTRLKKESLFFRIHDKNISELAEFEISKLQDWFSSIEKKLSKQQNIIAEEILKEIRARIGLDRKSTRLNSSH